jgi:lipopolysaccharide heptosyltransferase I
VNARAPQAARRMLVLRLSALGDVIHTIPAVALLREALPETRIEWVVESPYAELVETVARVGTIRVSMKKWGRALVASRGAIAEARARMRGADASVDFQGLIKSAVLGWMSGAKRRYGFDREAIREKAAGLFLNRRIAVDRTQHVVEWNLQLATAVAEQMWDRPPRRSGVSGPVDFAAFAADAHRDLDGSIVLLPGAGRPEKLWPTERFRALAQNLGDDALAVWGPGERELAEAIGCRVAPPTNLRELAGILLRAKLVIGADTGPLHLAAALGTPTIGLFGPTNPARNGPYGQSGHVVSSFDGSMTMDAITVEDVLETLET